MNSELAQDPEIQRLMAQQELLKNVNFFFQNNTLFNLS
jgi:hypothetical protein